MPPVPEENLVQIDLKQFVEWESLNDTIMGGSSQASCEPIPDGLLLKGDLIEEGGGFVSCRSPLISPSLNLSKYRGFKIDVEGQGRTLKFGVSCKKSPFGISKILPGAIKWVALIPTKDFGITSIKIPFKSLEPAIRAKQVPFPIHFDASCVNQFQILHSKFGQPGKMNPGFKAGPFKILLRSIDVYS